MPIVAILLGALMIDLGFRGTEHEFAQQLGDDFSGGGFWAWLGSITIIGALGYYSPMRKVSDLGIALVVIGLALSNGGIYKQFASLLTQPPQPAPPVALPSFSSSSGSASGNASSTSTLSTAGSLLMTYGPMLAAL